jgi:Integrase zinc binding domain
VFSATCSRRYNAGFHHGNGGGPSGLEIDEIIQDQATDPECQHFAATAGANYLFDYEDSCVLVRRSSLDGALKIVVPKSLQPRLLHLEHFSRTAGHPGVTRMFCTLRKRFFWKSMSADVLETVRQCDACARNRIKERTNTSYLKLFPASSPL